LHLNGKNEEDKDSQALIQSSFEHMKMNDAHEAPVPIETPCEYTHALAALVWMLIIANQS